MPTLRMWFLLLLSVLTAEQAAAEKASCPTCRGPVWSWDGFPAFFHGSDASGPNGGFTEASLDIITSFPIVTLEKWQGANVKPEMFEEQAWVVAAKQIKARNPNISVIVWYDSMRIYTADKSLNPDLRRACTTVHLRAARFLETHVDYLLKNRTGSPALESYGHCHVYDFTKDEVRQFWTEMCLNMTMTGFIDGCGADASWQQEIQAKGWGVDAQTAATWADGHKQMMRDTTKTLGDGILLGKQAYEVGDYVNGALCEGCPASNATIMLLQNLTRVAQEQGRRLIYECHGSGHLDEVAAFLVGAGPYHYYGFGGWQGGAPFENHWMKGVFNRTLGKPTGDGKYDAAAKEWFRSFAGGTTVRFNTETNTGTISWGSKGNARESAVLV